MGIARSVADCGSPLPLWALPAEPAEGAACGTGFGDRDLNQNREFWFQLFPDPNGQILACGIIQTGNLIQVPVVQFFPNRFKYLFDIAVIHYPAKLGIQSP